MEKRDVLKINRQFLLLTRQLAREGRAAEIMTGLPRAVIDKVASLDMDEIDELAETVPVSLYTFRLTDSALERLLLRVRNRARSGVGPRVFLQLQLDSDASTWRSELFAYALPPREQALRLWPNNVVSLELSILRAPGGRERSRNCR